jgi:hypothetical protein
MKRSFCLSALLVGLSLTTATAALAAPPAATEKQPVKRIAQTDPAPSTGSPTAAPGQAPTTQPAVSVGTGTSTTTAPASDTPATAPAEPAKKPAPRPFAGSMINLQTSMTTGTVFKGQQQDYNPTVEQAIWLLPRYAINQAFQLRARMIVNYEFTNSDSTTYRNEPTLSDTTLQLFYRKIPQLPGGIMPNLALNVGVPTSKLSRSRTNIITPGATLQLARPFEHVLGGDGLILAAASYSHPLYSSQNPVAVDRRDPNFLNCVGGNGCSDLVSGRMNPSDTLSWFVLAEMEFGHFSPALYYLNASQWGYTPPEARNPVDGTVVGRPTGTTATNYVNSHYFSAWLDYNINSWVTAEVGYWNSTSSLNGAGQFDFGNIFFNRYGDTRVYLSAAIQLDNLIKAVQGAGEGEAGVVRAKNTRAPIFSF